jgi:hypothetical protein
MGCLCCLTLESLTEGGRRQEGGVVKRKSVHGDTKQWCRVLAVSPALQRSEGALNRPLEQPGEADIKELALLMTICIIRLLL